MISLIEDTSGVSPIVATLLLVVVVASASSFIAVMVSDFGRDTAEVDAKDVGEAAAIGIDVIGTDLAIPATDALKARYGEINRGVKIIVNGYDTDAGISAAAGRRADIAAADRELTLTELKKYPALEPYQIGNAAIVVISNGQDSFTKENLRDLYNDSGNSTLGAFQYKRQYKRETGMEGKETGIEERFCEYLRYDNGTAFEINKTKINVTSFEMMLETIKEKSDSVGFIQFGYVMTGDNNGYIAGIENNASEIILAANITLEKITEAVREDNETLAEELYPEELRPPIYYVTNGKPSMMSDTFIKWVESPEGQEIMNEEGYVSLY